MKTKRTQLLLLVILCASFVALLSQRQAVADWLRLRNYSAPSAVAQLAKDDTMTSKAKHLLYVNRPSIVSGTNFTQHCPASGEKTVVLGCYVGNDAGIYIYAVTDNRLNGVEQVTVAHEMLHAAYRRLSSRDRAHVDDMLMNYYNHQLTDQRIKDTINAYKKSEPKDIVNEMHSIFGTEIASLPANLNTYYNQYFADRSKVTAFTDQYQNEFSSRRNLVVQYDAQLKVLKQSIDMNEAALDTQKAAIDRQLRQLESESSSGQIALYNSQIAAYNEIISNYNTLLTQTKGLISQYNSLVGKRNTVVFEEQQLVQELSASSLPTE